MEIFVLSIIMQVVGTAILLIPVIQIPRNYDAVIKAGTRYSNVQQRIKDNKKLTIIGIIGPILIIGGLCIQIYYT